MQTEPLALSDTEFSQLQQSVPDNGSGNAVNMRAVALAQLFLTRRHIGFQPAPIPLGADVAVRHNDQVFSYEIKGTRDPGLAPQQLKVSSLHSYNLLVAGMPLLRIASVFDRIPTVFILQHGIDFSLRPEPRWSVHLVSTTKA
ncbi:MAG: hypothetical protein WAO00_09310 [Chthoniobacterales bacterium]